ncbi:MAG: PEGA domain-containing protein [Candidatus Latescibacterota bacterium]|nr:MAG: PEGA domain-containing protein [Candidatus Latescibacterota bacterium]
MPFDPHIRANRGSIRVRLATWVLLVTITMFCVHILVCCCKPRPVEVPWYSEEETIEIVTDPPGAQIEVNGEHVGNAPLVVRVVRGSSNGIAKTLSIRALPQEPGYHTQLKVIAYGQRTPKKVFFDMKSKPAQSSS